MNPHSKPRPLIFTPRSPWGRLPLKHAQHHMRASEDKKPAPKLDAYSKSADEQRKLEEQKRRMDLNNTPRDLQGQISPHRAAEITNLTPQPPPSARAQPSLKDPPYQPPPSPPPQAFPMPAGSGVLRPPAAGQQIPVNPNSYSIPAAPADMLAPPALKFKNGQIGPDFEQMFKGRGPALKGEFHF